MKMACPRAELMWNDCTRNKDGMAEDDDARKKVGTMRKRKQDKRVRTKKNANEDDRKRQKEAGSSKAGGCPKRRVFRVVACSPVRILLC